MGIEEGGLHRFSIAPNPARTSVVIESPLAEQQVEIYNDLGQVIFKGVMSEGRLELSCLNWSSGLYLVRLGSQSKTLLIN